MEIDWHALGSFGVYSIAALLCVAGFLLSCLSLSGTWLVLAAAGLVSWHRWPGFPGIGTLVVFLLLCIAVELAEAFAAAWGIDRRKGSKAAGWAAVGGGLLGMVLGGFIPVPVVGPLLGMIAGSFGGAFLVEHAKVKETDHALHVATGAVIARIGVLFLKLGFTLGMAFALALGIVLT